MIISRQFSQLDPQMLLFPVVRFVLFYPDCFDDFIEQVLVSVKQNKSIAQQSTWNETICVLLRAKASKN